MSFLWQWRTVGLESRGRSRAQVSGGLDDDAGRFQASDSADGLKDAFIVIGEPSCLLGTADCHVPGALGLVHADTDCFLCHWLSLLSGPPLRDAGSSSPDTFALVRDLGVATTAPRARQI